MKLMNLRDVPDDVHMALVGDTLVPPAHLDAEVVTPYDAAWIAIAERLDAPLITCDGKLSGASRPSCRFELIT